MKRPVLIASVIAFVAALAIGWYIGSPIWTLKRMAAAASENDADGLATYIDFPAVRAALKAEFKAEAGQALLDSEGDGFEKLGTAIGAAMADSMIDALVTPESLRKMLSGQSSSGAPKLSFDLNNSDAEIVRDGLSQFRLRKLNGSALVFHRRGLGWQLVAFRTATESTDADETAAEEGPSEQSDAEGFDGTEENAEPVYSAAYEACSSTGDAGAGVTLGILNCNAEEIDRQDAELNRLYRSLMARAAPDEATALRDRQRNWIKLRDATCEEESADQAGGTFGQIIYSGCILRETANRVKFLNGYKLHSADNAELDVTAEWLIGTWGPAEVNPNNDPNASCETDGTITFEKNGTFRDGGAYGRFRTNGKTITYFNRVLYDIADDTEDRSEFNKPLETKVVRVDPNTFAEDGEKWRRCQG